MILIGNVESDWEPGKVVQGDVFPGVGAWENPMTGKRVREKIRMKERESKMEADKKNILILVTHLENVCSFLFCAIKYICGKLSNAIR